NSLRQHLDRATRLGDLFLSGFGEFVRLYCERTRQFAITQNFHRMLGLNHSRFAQHIGSDVRLTERNQPFQADDVVFLTENIREAPLGHAAMQWHLAAFKSAHHARSAARALAFVPSGDRKSTRLNSSHVAISY